MSEAELSQPNSDDDVATLTDTSPSNDEEEMSMNPTIQLAMDQGFANVHQTLQQSLARFNDGAAFVGQESKQSHLHRTAQYEALAQNTAEQDGQANRLMSLKAAGLFPTVQSPHYVHGAPGTP